MLAKEEIRRLKKLQKKIGYKFRRSSRLQQALTHSSYVNENPQLKLANNETLEFLGDAVLGLVITEYLYAQFPEYSEGKLSILKSVLVSEPTLAEIAIQLELGKYIFLGRGEDKDKAQLRPSLLSNTLEALIGAQYLDGGLKAVKKFILKIFKINFKEIPGLKLSGSFKNRLQQYSQTERGCIPHYRIVSESGPPHNRVYDIEVSFGGEVYGSGRGSSKKRAEQEAARQALIKLGLE